MEPRGPEAVAREPFLPSFLPQILADRYLLSQNRNSGQELWLVGVADQVQQSFSNSLVLVLQDSPRLRACHLSGHDHRDVDYILVDILQDQPNLPQLAP